MLDIDFFFSEVGEIAAVGPGKNNRSQYQVVGFLRPCGWKQSETLPGFLPLTISGCDAIPTTRLKSPKITCLLSVPFPQKNS